MSEIKGQLLGLLLVITIFGVISFTLYSSFTKAADSVASGVEVNKSGTSKSLVAEDAGLAIELA